MRARVVGARWWRRQQRDRGAGAGQSAGWCSASARRGVVTIGERLGKASIEAAAAAAVRQRVGRASVARGDNRTMAFQSAGCGNFTGLRQRQDDKGEAMLVFFWLTIAGKKWFQIFVMPFASRKL